MISSASLCRAQQLTLKLFPWKPTSQPTTCTFQQYAFPAHPSHYIPCEQLADLTDWLTDSAATKYESQDSHRREEKNSSGIFEDNNVEHNGGTMPPPRHHFIKQDQQQGKELIFTPLKWSYREELYYYYYYVDHDQSRSLSCTRKHCVKSRINVRLSQLSCPSDFMHPPMHIIRVKGGRVGRLDDDNERVVLVLCAWHSQSDELQKNVKHCPCRPGFSVCWKIGQFQDNGGKMWDAKWSGLGMTPWLQFVQVTVLFYCVTVSRSDKTYQQWTRRRRGLLLVERAHKTNRLCNDHHNDMMGATRRRS